MKYKHPIHPLVYFRIIPLLNEFNQCYFVLYLQMQRQTVLETAVVLLLLLFCRSATSDQPPVYYSCPTNAVFNQFIYMHFYNSYKTKKNNYCIFQQFCILKSLQMHPVHISVCIAWSNANYAIHQLWYLFSSTQWLQHFEHPRQDTVHNSGSSIRF